MGPLVNCCQTCAIPGRCTHTNLLLARKLLAYATSKCISGYVVSLEPARAFQGVEPVNLSSPLSAFGFPDRFVNTVRTFYKGISSAFPTRAGLSIVAVS